MVFDSHRPSGKDVSSNFDVQSQDLEALRSVNSQDELIAHLKKYPNKYNNLILGYLLDPNRPKKYIKNQGWNTHHIVPLHDSGPDVEWNKIILTVDEHMTAHRYRYEVYQQKGDSVATRLADGGSTAELIKERQEMGVDTARKKGVGFSSSETQKQLGQKGGSAQTEAQKTNQGKTTKAQVSGYRSVAQQNQAKEVTEFLQSDGGLIYIPLGKLVPIKLKDFKTLNELRGGLVLFLNTSLKDCLCPSGIDVSSISDEQKCKIQQTINQIQTATSFKDNFSAMIKKDFGKGTSYGFAKIKKVKAFDPSLLIENPLKPQENYLSKPLVFEHILTKTKLDLGLINHPSEVKPIFEHFCEELINSSSLGSSSKNVKLTSLCPSGIDVSSDLDAVKRQYNQLKKAEIGVFNRSLSQVLRKVSGRNTLYGFKPIFE